MPKAIAFIFLQLHIFHNPIHHLFFCELIKNSALWHSCIKTHKRYIGQIHMMHCCILIVLSHLCPKAAPMFFLTDKICRFCPIHNLSFCHFHFIAKKAQLIMKRIYTFPFSLVCFLVKFPIFFILYHYFFIYFIIPSILYSAAFL